MSNNQQPYLSFLGGVQPVILGLTKCQANLDRDLFRMAMKERKDERVLFADFKIGAIDNDHFDLSADFEVSIRVADGNQESEAEVYLKIDCSFYGHFHCHDNVDESNVRRFADSEARIVFMPYLREFVSSLTAKMWIPPVMIPIGVSAGKDSGTRKARRRGRKRDVAL